VGIALLLRHQGKQGTLRLGRVLPTTDSGRGPSKYKEEDRLPKWKEKDDASGLRPSETTDTRDVEQRLKGSTAERGLMGKVQYPRRLLEGIEE